MKSIYKKEKIDSGIEQLSKSIVRASKNSTVVIEKLNCLSQWPQNYPHASELIIHWHQYLFSNKFDSLDENWHSDIKFDKKTLYLIEFNMFNYFLSMLPFLFYEKTIIDNNKKYKWSEKEFNLLKIKLLHERYNDRMHLTYIEDPEGCDMVDRETKISLKHMVKSCNVTKKFFNKEKFMEDILSTTNLHSKITKGRPLYNYQFQEDLFLLYTSDFIEKMPVLLNNYVDDYYFNGTYLHKYFNWSIS